MEIRVRAFTGTVSADQGPIGLRRFASPIRMSYSTTMLPDRLRKATAILFILFVCISCLDFPDKKPLSIGSSLEQMVPIYLG